MKKILAFLALGLLLGACSGKLSSSKAEDLVEETLKEKPISDWLRKMMEGEIEKFYSITLTDKSKDYLLETGKYNDDVYENTMKTYTAELDKVSNIHIIPEMNVASAEATFVKKDKTPFFIFDDQTDSFTKGVKFQKTEDKGWQVYK